MIAVAQPMSEIIITKHARVASKLLAAAHTDGVTLHANGDIATSGIAVGGVSGEFSIDADYPPCRIEEFVKNFVYITAYDKTSGYGLWRDKDRIVLERVDILRVTQIVTALAIGKKRNQKLIYILDTETSVEV